MDSFKFELGDDAELLSGEKGQVIGRAEYTNCTPRYLIRYTAGDGRLVEQWWDDGAVKS